jgi:hypothetical protein
MERPTDSTFFDKARLLAAFTQPITDPTNMDKSTQVRLVDRGIIDSAEPFTATRTLDAMKQQGVTHIYSGAREGHSTPRLDLQAIRGDTGHFKPVYDRDGVVIFEVSYQSP